MTPEREDRIVEELRALRRCIDSNTTYVVAALMILALNTCGK